MRDLSYYLSYSKEFCKVVRLHFQDRFIRNKEVAELACGSVSDVFNKIFCGGTFLYVKYLLQSVESLNKKCIMKTKPLLLMNKSIE